MDEAMKSHTRMHAFCRDQQFIRTSDTCTYIYHIYTICIWYDVRLRPIRNVAIIMTSSILCLFVTIIFAITIRLCVHCLMPSSPLIVPFPSVVCRYICFRCAVLRYFSTPHTWTTIITTYFFCCILYCCRNRYHFVVIERQ